MNILNIIMIYMYLISNCLVYTRHYILAPWRPRGYRTATPICKMSIYKYIPVWMSAVTDSPSCFHSESGSAP